jgi:hypothetical protein
LAVVECPRPDNHEFVEARFSLGACPSFYQEPTGSLVVPCRSDKLSGKRPAADLAFAEKKRPWRRFVGA